jgi:hypothetical protein
MEVPWISAIYSLDKIVRCTIDQLSCSQSLVFGRFGGPALYFLGMECVLRWVFGIVGLFNVFFRIVSAASLVLLIVLIFQLIGRGLK